MSSYLQRLLDRSAVVPPGQPVAVPGGRSLSPVAEADQRLNDPILAGRFDLVAPLADEASSFEAEPVAISDAPGGAPRKPRPVAPRTSPSQDHDALTPATRPPIPSVEPAPPSTSRVEMASPPVWPPSAIGEVALEDWVIEPEQGSVPSPMGSPPVVEPLAPTAHALPRSETPHAILAQERVKPPLPATPPLSAPTSPPATPLAEGRRVEETLAEALPPTISPMPSAQAEQVGEEDKATTYWVEPPPSPPAPSLRTGLAPPALTPPATPTVEQIPMPSPPPAERPPASAAARRLTANEASIIGPLARRSGAITLFGLRRR